MPASFKTGEAFTQVTVSGCEQSRAADAAGHPHGAGICLGPTNWDTLSPVGCWSSVLGVWEVFYCLASVVVREVFLGVTVHPRLQGTKEGNGYLGNVRNWEQHLGRINLRQVEFKSDCSYIKMCQPLKSVCGFGHHKIRKIKSSLVSRDRTQRMAGAVAGEG